MPWKGREFGWNLPKPFLDFLPPAQDASVAALEQMIDSIKNSKGRVVTISADTIEGPSVDLAAKMMLDELGEKRSLHKRYRKVPKPDPRRAKTNRGGKGNFSLWKFGWSKAKPAVAIPADFIRDKVAALAMSKWDFNGNWRKAQEMVEGVAAGNVLEILAVMVHPPSCRSGEKAWRWLQRVQVAAAQMATRVEMNSDVGADKSLVLQLVDGPLDWCVDAALIASVQRANVDADFTGAVADRIRGLLERIPGDGYWSCEETAIRTGLLIEKNDGDFREFLLRKLESL